jgi:hypothetical protein
MDRMEPLRKPFDVTVMSTPSFVSRKEPLPTLFPSAFLNISAPLVLRAPAFAV